jgi:hypothetical protein
MEGDCFLAPSRESEMSRPPMILVCVSHIFLLILFYLAD